MERAEAAMKTRELKRGDRVLVNLCPEADVKRAATLLMCHGAEAHVDFGPCGDGYNWVNVNFVDRIPERPAPRVMWIALYTDDDGREREGQAWPKRKQCLEWVSDENEPARYRIVKYVREEKR